MEFYPNTTSTELSKAQKIKGCFKLLLLTYCLMILAGILIRVRSYVLKHKLNISIDSGNNSLVLNSLTDYILLVIFVPIIEEILFRLWQNYNKRNIIISLTLILLLPLINLLKVKHFSTTYFIILGIILISLFIFCLFWRGYTDQSVRISIKYKKLLFYVSAVSFGLLHITNFAPINYSIILIYPIFVLPQIIMGFTIGYTRIKYGFLYGLLLHCMINIIFAIIYKL